jgi:hypothetical protein
MPSALASPRCADELYDALGSDISIARPLMQGDVFVDVEIPGFDGEIGMAMILMHPCSMRAGPKLRSRLTLSRVTKHQVIPLEEWPNGHFDYMPLPGLGEDDSLASCFRDVGSVKSADLDPRKRIAVLSSRGIIYLQQRHIHCQTRLVVDLPSLQTLINPILDESELQEEWVDAALSVQLGTADELRIVQEAEKTFQDFMGTAESSLRQGLKNGHESDTRRRVREEITVRYLRTS